MCSGITLYRYTSLYKRGDNIVWSITLYEGNNPPKRPRHPSNPQTDLQNRAPLKNEQTDLQKQNCINKTDFKNSNLKAVEWGSDRR